MGSRVAGSNAGSLLTRARLSVPEAGDYVRNAWVEITVMGLGFVSGVLVTRWLGPVGRGQLAAAVMWPTTVGTICSLGLQQAFSYAASVGWADPSRLRKLALRFTLFLGIPAMVVYWYLCPWILKSQFGHETWIPRLFALFIPLSVYTGLLFPIYQGMGAFRRWNIGRLIRSGGWTAAVVVLGISTVLTVINLLLAQLFVLLALALYLAFYVRGLTGQVSGQGSGTIGAIFRYGFAVYLSGLAYTINQQLDQLLLSLWVAPAELGQYAAAAALAGVLLLVPSIVGPIAFSKIARAKHKADQRQEILGALWITFTILLPASLLVMALAPHISTILYGSSYLVAGQLLRVLAPAAIFLGAGIALSDIVRGIGKPMYATYGAVAGAAVTVAGLAVALPRYGIWGAAWVSFIAYAIMMLVQCALLWNSLRASPTLIQT